MFTRIGNTDIVFGDKRQPKALPLSHPKARWGGFHPGTTILPKGYQKREGCLALPCDIVFERDIPVRLRDGTMIYTDVLRPNDLTQNEKYPAIVAWSPYGKEGGAGNTVLDDFPFRAGVPLSMVSELQKWEGPDPAYWVNHGYAVVNPDPRGAMKSAGNICMWGSQEGRDGCDLINWVGEQQWCSGKVALSGNSWLSIAQWFIAAERPRHLACIAPWEGFTDAYRELFSKGGVITEADANFVLPIIAIGCGENSWENGVAMLTEPYGEYHEDHAAKVENINVPAYVVASWANQVHSYGTFSGYARLSTSKWLRVHDTWEWPDYYQPENQKDLLRFFDYYMKDKQNGWEQTPRFRGKILDTAHFVPRHNPDVMSTAFPLPEAVVTRFYPSQSGQLCTNVDQSPRSVEYELKDGTVSFDYTFPNACTLCGTVRMQLVVSVTGAKDADVYIYLEKVLVSGVAGEQVKLPLTNEQGSTIRSSKNEQIIKDLKPLIYQGPTGRSRVSNRSMDPQRAEYGLDDPELRTTEFVTDGEVVTIVPSIVPIGMIFSEGEKLRLHITGTNRVPMPTVPGYRLTTDSIPAYNTTGTLTVHLGEGSYISLPILT